MADALMGIDVGTSFIKAGVFDPEMQELGRGRARTPWIATPTGAEVDPRRLVDAAFSAVDAALRQAGTRAIAAVGVASMGESGVLIDHHGGPLAPAIAWYDTRAHAEADKLRHDLGEDFAVRAGRLPSEGLSVAVWRWLVDEYPDVTKAVRWLGMAEWIAFRLGAAPANELSLASRTGAVRVAEAAADPEALEWSGMRPGVLADLVPAGQRVGSVSTAFPRMKGAAITLAGLDAYASMVGAGAAEPQVLFFSCGTSGSAIRVVHGPVAAPQLADVVNAGLTVDRFVDGRSLALLGAVPCGLILEPLRDLLGTPESNAATPPLAEGLELGTDEAGSLWIRGFRPGVPPAAVWDRAYELVSSRQLACLGTLDRVAGPHRVAIASGGWARLPGFRHALQAGLPTQLSAPAVEHAVLGAAMLAKRTVEVGG